MPSDSTNVLKTKPGKLDIKRRKTGILFISLSSDYDVIFDSCVNLASLATSFKNATSSCPDKCTCCEIDNFYQETCGNKVNRRDN